MKKQLFITMGALAGLISLNSCENAEVSTISEDSSKSSQRVAAVGPWTRQFTENFTVPSSGSFNFSQWSRAARKDYNSNLCTYNSGVPKVEKQDFRDVLVINATKTGTDAYKSGLIKSTYNFKPARNEEFRVSSQIKLIAKDGATFKSFKQTYGAWPAFWTVQETNWPTQGEIDIMEGYSFAPAASRFASNLFYGTQTGTNLLGNSFERNYPSSFDVDALSGWHLYDCYWKNVNGVVTVSTYIDGALIATYTNSGSLKLENFGPHNVILNLNVGSNDNSFIDKAKINLFSSTSMWVDYVTVDKRTL
jgi:hypothetical protein